MSRIRDRVFRGFAVGLTGTVVLGSAYAPVVLMAVILGGAFWLIG